MDVDDQRKIIDRCFDDILFKIESKNESSSLIRSMPRIDIALNTDCRFWFHT